MLEHEKIVEGPPFTGMIIPQTAERKYMAEKLDKAYNAWYGSFGFREEALQKSNELADEGVSLPGIALVTRGDYRTDYFYRCYAYAFGTDKQEPWVDENTGVPPDFYRNTLQFLREHQYDIVPQADLGDIIGYGAMVRNAENEIAEIGLDHVGIYIAHNRVRSKLSMGPVVEHPLCLVPASYGSEIIVLRRNILEFPQKR